MSEKRTENNSISTVKKNRTLLKFVLSSFVCYIIDYVFYSLFVTFPVFFSGVVSVRFSNVGARIISSSLNFLLNRRFVFKDKDKTSKKAVEYFALAATVLVGSTFVLGFTVEHFNFNKYYAKIGVDVFFFIVNWLVQRFIIFKKD